MGNLQSNDPKSSKSSKSPGKANRLMKRRFARKKDQDFTNIVPEDAEEPGSLTLGGTEEPAAPTSTVASVPPPQDNEHTSSESVYTPAEFAAELNLCYRSEESVLDPPAYDVNGRPSKVCHSEESILDAPEIRNFFGKFGHELDVADEKFDNLM